MKIVNTDFRFYKPVQIAANTKLELNKNCILQAMEIIIQYDYTISWIVPFNTKLYG